MDVLGLTGRVAVVTGAGSQTAGIGNGRAAAALLAEAGAEVVIVDLSADSLDETARLVEERGGSCLQVVADVSSTRDCRRVVEETMRWRGRIDVLVNNVGVAGPAEDVVELDVEEWRRCFRVNVDSVMLMSRFTIPHMVAVGGGSVVNLSSLGGVISHPRPAYAASKAAVIGLTKSMAATHGPSGVRVNAVVPGMVFTPNVEAEGLDEAGRAARRTAAPLQIEGTGWDVAHAVLYLAGAQSRWVTGTSLTVDAGFSADLRLGSAATVTRHQETASTTGGR